MDIQWLTDLGASNADKMIFIIGMMFAAYVLLRDRQKSNQIELLFQEVKEIRRLYHQVDKLEAVNSLAIRTLSDPKAPIETMKQSADGKGDHALNRNV